MFRLPIANDAELRLLEPHHAAEVFSLIDAERDRLRVWLPWVDDARKVDDTRLFIEEALRKFAARQSIVAGIWSATRFAGVLGVDLRAAARTAEIGYWIGSDFEGSGLVTAACKAILGSLFDERGVHRVEIRCEPANSRSVAVAERLGLTYEGTLRGDARVNSRFVDHRVYSLLATERS